MVNNFELLKSYLDFKDPGDYYFLQLLRRAQDNPEFKGNQTFRTVKDYFVTSVEQFEALETEVAELCKTFKARAYLRLNKRNYKDTSLLMLKMLTEQVCSETYLNPLKLTTSAAGRCKVRGTKTWLVDLDKEHLANKELYKALVEQCEPNKAVVLEVPTKSGLHLVVEPFNLQRFTQLCAAQNVALPDVHKDNPTVLFVPDF